MSATAISASVVPEEGLSFSMRMANLGKNAYLGTIQYLVEDFAKIYGVEALIGTGLRESDAFCTARSLLHSNALSLVNAITEVRDPYTAAHQCRVGAIAVQLAQDLGMSSQEIDVIELASITHDIGKLRVPSEILSKPSMLDDAEFTLIRTHPQAGRDILTTAGFPMGVPEIVLSHHERMDGSGYPNGLKGDEIPLASQVIAVADVIEAMSSHRPYRPARGLRQALTEIEKNSGNLYNPLVAKSALGLRWPAETGLYQV